MSNLDETIFSSPPFKFIVEGKTFYVHTALASEFSKPLGRMMNGYMSEATQGFATLEDVDMGTFVRFSRWMYSGDYAAAEYTTSFTEPPESIYEQLRTLTPLTGEELRAYRAASSLTSQARMSGFGGLGHVSSTSTSSSQPSGSIFVSQSPFQSQNLFSSLGKQPTTNSSLFGSSSPEPKTVPLNKLKISFSELQYAVLDKRCNALPPRANKLSSEDYTEVFLSHARMYVFADKYDIQPLKMSAIRRLHQTLKVFKLYPARVADITSLIKYTYSNTKDSDNEPDQMRALLIHYVGSEMDILVKSEELKKLIEEGGPFVGDFLGVVGRTIRSQ